MSCPEKCGDCASTCPLCGKANLCRLADQGLHKGACWCERTEFPRELLDRVPGPKPGTSCICHDCLAAYRKEQKWHPRPGPGDYYIEEGGRIVFTESYHLRRGYCCGSGCRHCPYDAAGRPKLQVTAGSIVTMVAVLLVWLFTPAISADTVLVDFSQDPRTHGWVEGGVATLYTWDGPSQALALTWDSRSSNSFFALPLGTTVTLADSFSAEFDLRLDDYGERPEKTAPLQIALGFFNRTNTPPRSVTRTAGGGANLMELDFFPDGDSGPPFGYSPSTISPVYFSETGRIDTRFSQPLVWETGTVYHLRLAYDATSRTISASATKPDGTPLVTVPSFVVRTSLGDVALDAFGIFNWNEEPAKNGSILAHGAMDNLRLQFPPPPLGPLRIHISNDAVEVIFAARAGWKYQLEYGADLGPWLAGSSATAANDGDLTLTDAALAEKHRYYRVQASAP
ncbi:MAG TPA: cysteine-rich CWC family protein [Candidatus Limnocylindria bacterium]|nr:cysteine-rich CWC family protein [Candidatus Limnocylindria bacterium]